MKLALGIDTGGTYTDAVLINHTTGEVLAGAKALTTRHDLAIGIKGALAAVTEEAGKQHSGLDLSTANIDMVGLSTTLATNAIVEGQGNAVSLILIGYNPGVIERYGFARDLVTEDVVHIAGGHDGEGNETAPLDETALRDAVIDRRDKVDAFAVSGFFSVRNPAHELRAKQIIEELTQDASQPESLPLPVTCGHDLTTHLDAIRRATTTALNARLIPLLRDLTITVQRILKEQKISAPLMIVKGDGSLVKADWAMKRPIETILSGPAASVVGAWHLAGRKDVWVVDVGGTTSDIAVLRDGRPRLSAEGARVGGWQTMIETADVHTLGLGGDSHVTLGNGDIIIGPRRVVPLSLLANDHPEIIGDLRIQLGAKDQPEAAGQFLIANSQLPASVSDEDRALLERIGSRPKSLLAVARLLPYGLLDLRPIRRLEAQRLILRAGLTPTDALHVLGRFRKWNEEAARMGAELLATRLGLSPEAFCEKLVGRVSSMLTGELVAKVLADEGTDTDGERLHAALLARAVGDVPGSDLACALTLRQPVVAVGAPVEAYLPLAVKQLSTELVIPPHAEVANAVGAVAGGVVQRIEVLIRPVNEKKPYRLYLPDGVHDFFALEEAVDFAGETVPDQLEVMAREAGADHLEIRVERDDKSSPVKAGWGDEIFVETLLVFTAVGRPGIVG
jgi:N-methylhydantoinase A/oxoprolinase/acetone carboxylase beta subunit